MISEKDKPKLEYWNFPQDEPFRLVYRDLLSRLEKIHINIHADGAKPLKLDELVQDFLGQLESSGWDLFRVFADGQIFHRSVSASCLNTALCACLYSLHRGMDKKSLGMLARSCFLIDLGMLFIPSELMNRKGKLTDQERAVIETHPSITQELEQKWYEPPDVLAVALQHHENWDGTGYPKGLKEEGIHPWAQLAGLCQSYAAMATERDYRNSMVGYLSMKQLLALRGSRYSEALVMDFVNVMGLNPPGSVVLLSDGSIARVLSPSQESSLRPRIMILIDSQGNEYRDDNGPVVDLSQVHRLMIARPVNILDLDQETQ